MMKKNKILFIVFVILFMCSISYIVCYFLDTAIRQKLNNKVADIGFGDTFTTLSSSEEKISKRIKDANESQNVSGENIPIDFEALKEINSDIYAWIDIPSVGISLPIVQHGTDDDYYLRRDLENKYDNYGSIYTQICNDKGFNDANTIIYGHDTQDGKMFGPIRKYYNSEFLEDNRDIIIYTPTEKRMYKIFSAVVYDDRYIPYVYDIKEGISNIEFVNSMKDVRDLNSIFFDDMTITEDSEIITLSTCYGTYEQKRYLIGAVYVQE